ncbi:hypothetical protein F5Y04DRAFT_291492 [Hypomontagnella monticulosa]|nr:hypothetical protein F5Y04DRAFT_291492 [Hypomontagnella monticulosa]
MAVRQLKSPNSRRQAAGLFFACSISLFLLLVWNHRALPDTGRGDPTHIAPYSGNPAPTGTLPPSSLLQHQHHPPHPTSDQTPEPDLSSPRAPFIPWPLRRVCAETTYVPGLTFLCDENSGGPGNIRNYILTCLRYAIDAGATGLVLPRIRARSSTDKAELFREYQAFGYMFSEAHFRAALGDACPRIAIYDSLDSVPGVKLKAQREGRTPERVVETVTPKHFGGLRAGCDQRDPNRHTDRFGAAFREWVRVSAAERGWAPTNDVDSPRLIRFSWGVLWDWPVYRDGPEFAATFGGLLRIRDDILDIADAITASMRTLAATTRGTETVAGQSFLGIHLRTEADALSQWPSYENQTKNYLREAASQGYQGRAAYLASGNETETRKFGKEAMAVLELVVKSKYDLLEDHPEELEKLKALSWDQQALVDFAVLVNSDYFVGVSPSSFSINVALKRHLKEEGLYTRPWKVGGRGDGRSWLVGRYERYWEDWLFMFDGMWA